MRLSLVMGIIVALLLLTPIVYSSYVVHIVGEEPISKLVIVEQIPSPNVTTPHVLGVSVDWTNNANGLYDNVSGLLNPAPVSQLINLEPSHLRFPAGRLSQVYDWKAGVGNRNERGSNPAGGGETQLSLFGTDEFMKLVNHAGSKAVIAVNSNTGSSQSAADWVSYCNDDSNSGQGRERSANGYYTPYSIKDWEIGNEPYLPKYWEGRGTIGVGAGTLYGQQVKNFSVAMKSIDPTIRVGAWMVLHPDMELTSADRSWNIDFLNTASGQFNLGGDDLYYFDYAVVKVYLPEIDQLMDFPDLFRYSYAVTYRTMMEDLAQIRGLLANNPRAEGPIPVAIAGFEPDFGEEGWNNQVPAMAGSALLTADLAMQIMRLSLDGGKLSIKYACYGDLNSPSYTSLMVNPDFKATTVETWGQSPSYLGLELAKRLQGGIPFLVTELEGPSYDVMKEGDLPGIRKVPYISAFATGDPTSGKAWVLLLNRDLDRSVECHISLAMERLTAPELSVRSIRFDSILSDNLADDSIKAPLPTSKSKRHVDPDGFSVRVGRAGVMLLTLETRGAT